MKCLAPLDHCGRDENKTEDGEKKDHFSTNKVTHLFMMEQLQFLFPFLKMGIWFLHFKFLFQQYLGFD